MKCIKTVMTGEIKRVSDAVAHEYVGKGWVYVSKSEWKAATRTKPAAQPTETVTTSSDSAPRRNREKKNKK
jgi:hypothetical protein